MGDKAEKPDMTWRVIGGLIALGVGFATRKAVAYGWQKTTGKKPPADPDSLEVGMAEAIGYAVVTAVGMEVARIVATRAAAKRYKAWSARTVAKAVAEAATPKA
ncbi:hypothetical protein Misp01_28710 [Microtetraspora sp. NBRC 13810]|uniref:DUF4235 domain-containing protein n=1 Tax=Microtetraspora sp. NBRC 13810 TaxID=3030990 RepID=UPI0024A4D0C8|nr:DUF4235 domain-containing protein [Microtetraspora sp. NBRC 13810]GLW07741.1 hypothetical protein Misp01_28710 [Microtetraspora sp. NBRC 13810]